MWWTEFKSANSVWSPSSNCSCHQMLIFSLLRDSQRATWRRENVQTWTYPLSLFPSCLLPCASVWRSQPPASHRPGQLCESAQQKPRRRLGAVPLAVCSGQRHPGSCQWQQTHPVQVSGSLCRRDTPGEGQLRGSLDGILSPVTETCFS